MNDPSPVARPLRIVRIIDRLNVGGPAQHVAWLGAGLARHGVETVLLTGRIAPGEGDMADVVRAAGVTPHFVPGMGRSISPRDVLVVVRLVRLLRRIRPDVVHTHKAKAGAVGRVAALIYRWMHPRVLRSGPRRCAVVHTFHGHVLHGYYGAVTSRCFVLLERLLARASDVLITLSPSQRAEIRDRYAIGRRTRVAVVPLGLDVDALGSTPGRFRSELGLAADVPLVGTVGRLAPIKDHATFLAGAAGVLGAGIRAHFAVVGDGTLRPALEAQARRLGIAEAVSFTGFRRDVGHLYADMDVVALTSRNEGTPLTILEALACRRPVLATDVGGVGDLLGERRERVGVLTLHERGITIPAGDPEAFAAGVRFLLAHADLRREMGDRGAAFVSARMSKERLIRDVLRVYEGLADGSAGSAGGVEYEGADHRRGGVHRVPPGGAAAGAGR